MRKLVLILAVSIAVITFIRAFDYSEENYSFGTHSDGINAEEPYIAETALKVVQ